MNEIVKVFEDRPVRIVEENGNPLFVGMDVCVLLGYKNPRKAMNDHCKGVTKRYPLSTNGGVQELRVISEPDVMRLICGSKLPAAVRFEKWVFEEVLPSIRKTGTYSISRDSTAELVEQINRKLLAGEDVPPHVLEYVSRIAGKPLAAETRPETKMLPFNSPKLSRTAQITMVFRSLPGLTEFLDRYTDWTPRTEFVNAFYQQYADFVCGVDRCRWWDALQRLRPLERTRTTGCQFIRFK